MLTDCFLDGRPCDICARIDEIGAHDLTITAEAKCDKMRLSS
jgi:hypothetical protein